MSAALVHWLLQYFCILLCKNRNILSEYEMYRLHSDIAYKANLGVPKFNNIVIFNTILFVKLITHYIRVCEALDEINAKQSL